MAFSFPKSISRNRNFSKLSLISLQRKDFHFSFSSMKLMKSISLNTSFKPLIFSLERPFSSKVTEFYKKKSSKKSSSKNSKPKLSPNEFLKNESLNLDKVKDSVFIPLESDQNSIAQENLTTQTLETWENLKKNYIQSARDKGTILVGENELFKEEQESEAKLSTSPSSLKDGNLSKKEEREEAAEFTEQDNSFIEQIANNFINIKMAEENALEKLERTDPAIDYPPIPASDPRLQKPFVRCDSCQEEFP